MSCSSATYFCCGVCPSPRPLALIAAFANMPSEPTKILIADDDPAMLRLLAKWLEGEGYQVLRAGDGRMAMELIEAERPRLLVTDWEMPNINGLELCRWV